MNKKKDKLAVFDANHRLHFMDMATSPLGKKLSRAGYVEDKHLEAVLYLFGFDIYYEYWEEHLDPEALMRSDFTKEIYKGGSIFTGVKRKDFDLRTFHANVFGGNVDNIFELISGGSVVETTN